MRESRQLHPSDASLHSANKLLKAPQHARRQGFAFIDADRPAKLLRNKNIPFYSVALNIMCKRPN
jgi:hypothetical protein